jgi:hypothetical protein
MRYARILSIGLVATVAFAWSAAAVAVFEPCERPTRAALTTETESHCAQHIPNRQFFLTAPSTASDAAMVCAGGPVNGRKNDLAAKGAHAELRLLANRLQRLAFRSTPNTQPQRARP